MLLGQLSILRIATYIDRCRSSLAKCVCICMVCKPGSVGPNTMDSQDGKFEMALRACYSSQSEIMSVAVSSCYLNMNSEDHSTLKTIEEVNVKVKRIEK